MNGPIDISNVVLETERLILRPWEVRDLEDLFSYSSIEGVGERAGWTHHKSIEESLSVLELFIRERKTFALVLKNNNKVIGSIGLEGCRSTLGEEFNTLVGRDIGYVLHKDYWGQGLMTEAVKRVIEYSFKDLNYDFLSCVHYTYNNQSRRVIEKCGFTFYKDIRSKTKYGTVEDSKLYVLINNK
ncbi:GNAT family N-acetyltransferase [Alloiococcus sp. CFN-8]|uniref:GNAT family N-acetyltransferase n=1 Tax=Alloiococcus sp. CFN-8 TaxID=3416081 RepID=UPI003CFB0AC4